MSAYLQRIVDSYREWREDVERRLGRTRYTDRALKNIDAAQSLLDRELVHGDSDIRFGWEAHLEAAHYALQLAAAYPQYESAVVGQKQSSENGKRGVDAKHPNRQAVTAIIERLARRPREYFSHEELWNEFVGILDAEHIPLTMELPHFRNRISAARKNSR